MRITSYHTYILSFLASVAAAVGCASDADSQGTISVNLVGQAPSGATYRLRNATIVVDGPTATQVWNTEDDPNRTSLSASVAPGVYSALLQSGWRLERVQGSSVTDVVAQLVSGNPVQFTVAAERRTTVPLSFRVDSEEVDMAQGYDIVLDIDESPPMVFVTNPGQSSITVYPRLASGNVVPRRVIAGAATQMMNPFSVTASGNELIVCDPATASVHVYPFGASGEVAPIRTIHGPSTQLVAPTGATVANGELYIGQADRAILVYPLDASGDVAPRRMITGLGGVEEVAIDNGELYTVSAVPTGVGVFPASSSGGAPARFIVHPDLVCPFGIAARQGELFVADACRNAIFVFPEQADGNATPLRKLAGPSTGLNGPGMISLFRDEIYVTGDDNSVRVFPAGANGDVAPTRVIIGDRTLLNNPIGVSVQ